MKTYEIWFTGRKVGAIGIHHEIRTQVFADNEEAALLGLYERFEHIARPQVKEIQSPFDATGLVERIQNERDEHKLIRLCVQKLRDALDEIANRQRQDNADWHDDPDATDHMLFHAPTDQQFPQPLRDAAIIELVSRHLEVLNQNEAARKQVAA